LFLRRQTFRGSRDLGVFGDRRPRGIQGPGRTPAQGFPGTWSFRRPAPAGNIQGCSGTSAPPGNIQGFPGTWRFRQAGARGKRFGVFRSVGLAGARGNSGSPSFRRPAPDVNIQGFPFVGFSPRSSNRRRHQVGKPKHSVESRSRRWGETVGGQLFAALGRVGCR
jgi:hypothetical protein